MLALMSKTILLEVYDKFHFNYSYLMLSSLSFQWVVIVSLKRLQQLGLPGKHVAVWTTI